jgi:hypothetical protein
MAKYFINVLHKFFTKSLKQIKSFLYENSQGSNKYHKYLLGVGKQDLHGTPFQKIGRKRCITKI